MANKEIGKNTWNVGGGPDGPEMFSCVRDSNCDSKKSQPISKVHKNGGEQSKVA
jgi:hypothetical protein